MAAAKQQGRGNRLSSSLARARQAEQRALRLAKDIKTVVRWLDRDILALAGPSLTERRALFDFVVAELKQGFLAQTAKNMQYDFVGFSASPARTVVIIANS